LRLNYRFPSVVNYESNFDSFIDGSVDGSIDGSVDGSDAMDVVRIAVKCSERMAPWSTENVGKLGKIDTYDEKCCIGEGKNSGKQWKTGSQAGKTRGKTYLDITVCMVTKQDLKR
jgi:hypothetical protein